MSNGRGVHPALAGAALAAVFALMTIGNVVSATGSGLACPDWPLCHGRLIPPLRPDVLIEYSHRLTAAFASLLVITASVAAIRRASARATRRVGAALLVLLGVQIGLGAVTVRLGLPHLVSTAHLVVALLILAGLIVLLAQSAEADRTDAASKLSRLGRAGLIVLLFQLALGGFVRHAGAGLACPDFPLCSGAILPGHWLATVHWVHRWLGVMLLGLFVHLALAARGTRLGSVSALAAVLATVQVLLGIAVVLLQLAPVVRAVHAVVAYALWGILVWISLCAGSWNGLLAGSPNIRERAKTVVHA
jgi:heme a synthase